MTGVDGKPQRVTCIGDMPIMAKDLQGVWRKLILRNVRCVPTFRETLISVDQLWEDSKVDTVFNSVRCVTLPAGVEGPAMDLPFFRQNHLYQWTILPVKRHSALQQLDNVPGRAMKATVHRPRSTDHVSALPPDEAVALLHRRMHVGLDQIRRLCHFATDVPKNVKAGHTSSCEHCKEANATTVPHSGNAYAPSHPGRLIHADIVGPFHMSKAGFQYMIVFVDDHSRFKSVYFLKRKSDAVKRVRSFVAKINALASLKLPLHLGYGIRTGHNEPPRRAQPPRRLPSPCATSQAERHRSQEPV